MQVSHFTNLLEDPTQIVTEKQTLELEKILENYPFFQAARGMHLLGLKNTNNYQYNAALKKHAAYTADRSWLFEIITSEVFNPTFPETEKPTELTEHHGMVKEASPEKINSIITHKQVTPKIDSNLDLGKPLIFNKNDRHSFEEWLTLTSETPEELTPYTSKLSTNEPELNESIENFKEAKMAQIDAFLAKTPKINALKKPSENIDITASLKLNKEALMTETLARVYLEQMKYKKALQAYRILSLKYPEKNSFFASQIKSIQKIIKDKNKS